VNRDEIKHILLVYRPGTADAEDPEIAEALALAKNDPELSQWLEEHCARQNALRAKFRQIAVPAGLKEQIISEQAARARAASRREKIVGAVAVVVIAVALLSIGVLYFPRSSERPTPNTLANYQTIMMSVASSGYYMNLLTNDPAKVQQFLAKNHAPADYEFPAGLQKATLVGCAVQDWKNAKASMICFKTGKSSSPNQTSDLWLFVVDSTAVNGDANVTTPQFTKVNGLITATWTQNGKLYLLGTQGDEQTIRQYL
jgi:hypothetical protein